MRLDGTITYGHILTAITVVLGFGAQWGMNQEKFSTQDKAIAAQYQQFAQSIARVDEALKEQRLEMKDQAKSLNAITTDTALIRGRLASGDGVAGRAK